MLRRSLISPTGCAALVLLIAAGPASAHPLQGRPSASELKRACAVAEEAWPVIQQVLTQDAAMRVQVLPFAPRRYFLGSLSLIYQADGWRDAAQTSSEPPRQGTPVSQALVRHFLDGPDMTVIECEAFAAKRASEQSAAPSGQRVMPRLVSLPIVSSDGASALVFVSDRERTVDNARFLHLAKSRGAWRVAGVRYGPGVYTHFDRNPGLADRFPDVGPGGQ